MMASIFAFCVTGYLFHCTVYLWLCISTSRVEWKQWTADICLVIFAPWHICQVLTVLWHRWLGGGRVSSL